PVAGWVTPRGVWAAQEGPGLMGSGRGDNSNRAGDSGPPSRISPVAYAGFSTPLHTPLARNYPRRLLGFAKVSELVADRKVMVRRGLGQRAWSAAQRSGG